MPRTPRTPGPPGPPRRLPGERAYRSGYSSYQAYLTARLRKSVLERSGGLCEHCGSGHKVVCHHKTYPELFGQETPDTLMALCRICQMFAEASEAYRVSG